ncbi:MAG: hypothetical protein J7493_09830 [Porphyrobacter sp.]|nr:hypothetical protein [Porphyrobacter sp.]
MAGISESSSAPKGRIAGPLMFAALAFVLLAFTRQIAASVPPEQTGMIVMVAGLSLNGLWLWRGRSKQQSTPGLIKAWAGAHFVVLLATYPKWWPADLEHPQALAALAFPLALHFLVASNVALRSHDASDRFERFIAALLPERLAPVLRLEFGILWAALTSWRRPTLSAGQRRFTSYGTMAPMLVAVLVLSFAEIAILHIVLRQLSHDLATIVTAIGIFSAIYIFGLLKSLRNRPSIVDRDQVMLRIGNIQSASFPRMSLSEVRRIPPSVQVEADIAKMGAASAPNVLMRFCAPITLNGPFGTSKSVSTLAIHVDRPDDLIDALRVA